MALKKKTAPKTTSDKKKSTSKSLIEDTFTHLNYGGLSRLDYDCSLSVVREARESEDSDSYKYILIDCSVWPPKVAKAHWLTNPLTEPIKRVGEKSLWKEPVSESASGRDDFRVIEATSLDIEKAKPWAQNASFKDILGSDPVTEESIFHTARIYLEKEQSYEYRITQITSTGHKNWITLDVQNKFLPISESSGLIVTESSKYALLSENKKPKFVDLPYEISDTESSFVVGDEIIYTSRSVTSHPEVPSIEEVRLQLNRVNYKTGEHSHLIIKDLFVLQNLTLSMYMGEKKKKIQIKSFDGTIRPQPGSKGWWILNFVSPTTGRRDLCWLWQPETNDILRIHTSEFPKKAPRLKYIKDLGRYVADESCDLSLLMPFDEMSDYLKKEQIEWTKD